MSSLRRDPGGRHEQVARHPLRRAADRRPALAEKYVEQAARYSRLRFLSAGHRWPFALACWRWLTPTRAWCAAAAVPKAALKTPLDTKKYSADCAQIGPGWYAGAALICARLPSNCSFRHMMRMVHARRASLGGLVKDCKDFLHGCPNMTWSRATSEDCVSSLPPPSLCSTHVPCTHHPLRMPCATHAAALPERVRAGEQH